MNEAKDTQRECSESHTAKPFMAYTWLSAAFFVFALGWVMWLDGRLDRRDVQLAVDLATRHDRAEIVALRHDLRIITEGGVLCNIDSLSFLGHPNPNAAQGLP